jgi:trigger factor
LHAIISRHDTHAALFINSRHRRQNEGSVMQVTETVNEGLKREIKVVVPKTDLAARLETRLHTAKDRARINGFRPGKVPVAHLRKVYGKSFMAEVVNEILNDTPKSVLADRNEKAAMQPVVNMSEDEKEAEKVLNGQADFEFSIAYEIVPSFALQDHSKIAIIRDVVAIPDGEVEEQVKVVAKSAQTWAEKKGKAAKDDRVTINYLGKIDGVPFDGGAADDAQLVLGSNQFIPGFEDQLIGIKAGDEKIITVTFPENYGAAHLAGKAATFDITCKLVEKAEELVLTDDVAVSLGLKDLEHLRKVVREQMESQFGTVTRQRVKRAMLDQLDKLYAFDAPSGMVDAEFGNIWRTITMELEQAGKTFADEDTTEEEARAEYRKLAERRVRLGLVLSQIGDAQGVTVSDDETQRALFEQVRQFRGQEQQVYDFYRKNPEALASLRAPIFEEKVIDHLLTVVSVTELSVTREELMALEAADEENASAKAGAKEKKAPAKKKAKAE